LSELSTTVKRWTRLILGPFNLEVTQTPRFIRTLDHLVLNGKNQSQGLRRHPFHEKRSHSPIQIRTWNTLTWWFSLLNAFVRAEIIRHNAASCSLVIAHRHAFSTPATENETL